MLRFLKIFAGLALVLTTVVGCQILRNSGQETLPPQPANSLRLATYNVHYIILFEEDGSWSVGDWERRKGPLQSAFRAMGADVIAFQEMESFGGNSASDVNLTLDWLLSQNPRYRAAAVGDPAVFPSTQPILYRADRVAALDQGWFFFSDTPDVIYSPTFNGSYPAFASWAQFRDRESNAAFRVVNLHTDFASRSNRTQSIELVAARIRPWIAAGETVFVTGDFNARAGSALLGLVEAEGVRFVEVDGATYHFNRGLNLFGAIDHIGVAGGGRALGPATVLRQRFDGEWPTDHYPVIADFDLAP